MIKGSLSKTNKSFQILLFDVVVIHGTPKVSFSWRISEDDGEQLVSLQHSHVQLLHFVIKAIVFFRSRILKSLFAAWLQP